VPLNYQIVEDGYTEEEVKLRDETRKILEIPGLPVPGTCVACPYTQGIRFDQRRIRARGSRSGRAGIAAQRARRDGRRCAESLEPPAGTVFLSAA
jgi:hypothetical protein